jgi:hypothetical protein
MSEKAMQQIRERAARAVEEARWVQRAVHDPQAALEEYDLSPEEHAVLAAELRQHAERMQAPLRSEVYLPGAPFPGHPPGAPFPGHAPEAPFPGHPPEAAARPGYEGPLSPPPSTAPAPYPGHPIKS